MEKSRRILVVAYDQLGERQAGPAIRTLALARELASVGLVDVVYEGEEPAVEPYDGVSFIRKEEIEGEEEFFGRYSMALVPPLVALIMPGILETEIPIVVDLYDPVVWENLELYREKPEKERVFQHERHLAALLVGLLRGDFFLVGGNRQRDLYLGALMVLNRVNPMTWRVGEGPEQIIGLVPFGVPNEPPPSKDELPVPEGMDVNVPLIVWGGGMWDWLEPEIVVKAMPEVLRRYPGAKLVFPGTEHPNPHVPVMGAVKRVKRVAEEVGVNGSIVMAKWLPRGEYLGLLAHASCGVSAHVPGLESRYAARTRYLDAIWMGMPMVVSEGDEYAEYIASHKLGVVVRPSNPTGFAQGILRVLDEGKNSFSGNFVRVRQRLCWRRMAAPLVEWAKAPRKTHGEGSSFFQEAVGQASPRSRPRDFVSLLMRVMEKLKGE